MKKTKVTKTKVKKFTIIFSLVFTLLLFLTQFVFAYPVPSAVIGEVFGLGANHAYVFITASDPINADTLYYNSLQADDLGRFVDIIPLDSGTEFILTVQLLPSNGEMPQDSVTIVYEDVRAGDENYVNYTFPETEEESEEKTEEDSPAEESETPSSGGSSGGGSGGSSGGSSNLVELPNAPSNTVGKVIQVPIKDEIIDPEMGSSPLTDEQEEQLQKAIDVGEEIIENKKNDQEETKPVDNKIKDKNDSKSLFGKLLVPIKNMDLVAMLLLGSMIMIFSTIMILLVIPEKEDSDEDEIAEAEKEAKKPIRKRKLKLQGRGGLTDSLDSEKEVNDIKETEFSFIGEKK